MCCWFTAHRRSSSGQHCLVAVVLGCIDAAALPYGIGLQMHTRVLSHSSFIAHCLVGCVSGRLCLSVLY